MSTFKCLCCNKNYHKQVEENLKKNFANINKFSNHDISKFIMFLRKSVYSYQCMNDWEKFNEASLPDKVDYYSHLNMEYITDADYMHAKRACRDFEEFKEFRWIPRFINQSDTLLLVDVFSNF